MTKTEYITAIREMGGTCNTKMRKAELETIYAALTENVPATTEDVPATEDAATATTEDAATTQPAADNQPAPATEDARAIADAARTVSATTPAPAAAIVNAAAAIIQTAATEDAPAKPAVAQPVPVAQPAATVKPAADLATAPATEDVPAADVYKRLDAEVTTETVSAEDKKLFTTIENILHAKFGTNVNIEDIPTVTPIVKDAAKYPTLETTRAAGVASASVLHLTTFRRLRVPGTHADYANVQVIIYTININNLGAYDSKYYFDAKPATDKDIANGNAAMALDADGHLIQAKLNNGRIVKRVRSTEFILTHTIKREIDIYLEKELRARGIFGKFYTYFDNRRLVD